MHELQADECTDGDFNSWRKLVDELAERALTMVPGDPDEEALCPRLKSFMARYSYRDGAGWWVCDCDDKRPASVYTPAYESDGLREWVLSLLDGYAVMTHLYGDEGYEASMTGRRTSRSPYRRSGSRSGSTTGRASASRSSTAAGTPTSSGTLTTSSGSSGWSGASSPGTSPASGSKSLMATESRTDPASQGCPQERRTRGRRSSFRGPCPVHGYSMVRQAGGTLRTPVGRPRCWKVSGAFGTEY